MMIKVSNEFLEFEDSIEIEKKIKLIEEIATIDGDFSYSFDLQKTIKNTELLGNPQPDNISKPVYQRIPAQVLNNSGIKIFDGYLRVEKITDVYQCSFFAGNNNWFAMITGLLSDMNLASYDIAQTSANIQASWLLNEGLVFPLVDNGSLLTRSYPQTKIEDYIGGFYLKTIFEKVFIDSAIKIQGDLLTDWRYNNAILLKNSKNQTEIDNRSCYVSKNSSQFIAGDPDTNLITWDDDSTYPYFDGSQNNFDVSTERYTADVKMVVEVSVTVNIGAILGDFTVEAWVNGVFRSVICTSNNVVSPISGSKRISLNQSDYLEIYGTICCGGIASAVDIDSATLKITPTYIYKTFGNSAVPNWTKQDFVSNVLRMFNVLASYNNANSTLTLNLFEKINSKDPIDLSEYITETEVDYIEFISNYGQRSKLSYNEVSFDELKNYNFGKYFKYGQGVINVNNEFLESDVDIVEIDFSNPLAYIHPVFDMSMERLNLIELSTADSQDFTGVTDNSGVARVAIPEDLYIVGDLLRIEDSVNPVYNGDWVVETIGAGWVELTGMNYSSDSTGKISKLEYNYSNEEDVFVLINVPNYTLTKFSGKTSILLETSSITDLAFGYFDLIFTNRAVNRDFIYSMSFGGIDSELQYQTTMTESYFALFAKVLNDPVKLLSTAYLPLSVFEQIDFLSPIIIRTMETTNRYYLNVNTGYKDSYLPCTLELIKI